MTSFTLQVPHGPNTVQGYGLVQRFSLDSVLLRLTSQSSGVGEYTAINSQTLQTMDCFDLVN